MFSEGLSAWLGFWFINLQRTCSCQKHSVSGHKTRAIFDRYNIVSEDLRRAMQQQQTYLRAKGCGFPEEEGSGQEMRTRTVAPF
jgi:hypothetical protein